MLSSPGPWGPQLCWISIYRSPTSCWLPGSSQGEAHLIQVTSSAAALVVPCLRLNELNSSLISPCNKAASLFDFFFNCCLMMFLYWLIVFAHRSFRNAVLSSHRFQTCLHLPAIKNLTFDMFSFRLFITWNIFPFFLMEHNQPVWLII